MTMTHVHTSLSASATGSQARSVSEGNSIKISTIDGFIFNRGQIILMERDGRLDLVK